MENDHDILLISIFTCITVFAWICFELIQTSKTSTIPEATQKLLVPLNANIDTKILTDIQNRTNYK